MPRFKSHEKMGFIERLRGKGVKQSNFNLFSFPIPLTDKFNGNFIIHLKIIGYQYINRHPDLLFIKI